MTLETVVVCNLCLKSTGAFEWWKGVTQDNKRIDVCKKCEEILDRAASLGIHAPLVWPEPETVVITEEELISAIKEFSDE